jgi:carbon monoxide dehydrogenase subunit G
VKIEDEFRVDVPVDEAWKVLLDVERIAPCMPGAQLQEVEGEEYRGIVKVKVGPITAQYKGAARIVETDEAAHKLVLKADGRDTRGQGNASATVTATLTADGGGTRVHIDTDLNITGKVAQFGRGVMADVSSKLLGQFATNLERDVLSGNGSGAVTSPTAGATAAAAAPSASSSGAGSAASPAAGASGPTEATGVRTVDSPEAEPVDLFDTAGNAVAKRVVPIVLAVVAFLALRSIRKRRKRKRQQREE